MVAVETRAKIAVKAYKNTAIYKNVILGFKGCYFLIVGINAIKDTIRAAMF
jgi:hypothetical protein